MISGDSATVCEASTIYLLVGSGIRKGEEVYGWISSRTGVACTALHFCRTRSYAGAGGTSDLTDHDLNIVGAHEGRTDGSIVKVSELYGRVSIKRSNCVAVQSERRAHQLSKQK
jgi:hypothetical protein